MLPDVDVDQLDAFAEDGDLGPLDALKTFRIAYQKKSHAHQAYVRMYALVYYIFGGVAVIMAVVLNSVDGCEDPDLLMAMSLSVAILTTVLNFFGIEKRLERHDAAKNQYENLQMEIEKFLLTSKRLRSNAEQLERSCFDRFKMIAQNEPDLSLCCLK